MTACLSVGHFPGESRECRPIRMGRLNRPGRSTCQSATLMMFDHVIDDSGSFGCEIVIFLRTTDDSGTHCH